MSMDIEKYDRHGFDRGKPAWVEAIWIIIHGFLFSTWLPGSNWRVEILRIFGAKIGMGVIIKPYIKIKFPWRLTVGDYSWIGEGVWIDNLDQVVIGSNVCMSQGEYICTGNHDYKDEAFRLMTESITIEDECWIGAFVKIAPGVIVKKKSMIALGSVVTSHTEENSIYAGNPAMRIRQRN